MNQNNKIIYIRPKRAIKKLKAADEENITAYIYGVTGIGKTELIKRYLGRKKYTYFDMAEIQNGELEVPVSEQRQTVVVDNLHELVMLKDSEQIKAAIVNLIKREDVWLIIAGRSNVPPWLTAVRYKEVFYIIEQSELMFDAKDDEQYIQKMEMIFSSEQNKSIKESCQGLPVGWNITYNDYVQERLGEDKSTVNEPLSDERFNNMVQKGFAQMWDYLEYHVYDKWDVEMYEFLLEISIVDKFTVRLAEMITGRSDVEPLIENAKWIGNFLLEDHNGDEITYELVEPMRISMKRHLQRKYTKEKIKTLYENAGLYYQLIDEPLKALEMYESVGDTERLVTILIDNVRKAVNNAYYYELKHFYLELPEDRIRTSPELMSGMSMLQSLLLNIPESERWYSELEEYEKTHTGSERRLAKSRLLYLEIGLPHRGSENMVNILKKSWRLLSDKQVSLGEFSVTSNQASQMNGGKDFCEWSKRDRELAGSIGKIVELILGRYGKGLVNLALAESLFEKGEDNFEVVSLANRGRMQAESGGKIEQCFVADGILAWLYILTGKAVEAHELMERFYQKAEGEQADRLYDNIKTFIARCDLYTGDKAAVSEWLDKAPDEELGFSIYDRFHYMTKIRVYLLNGRNEQAYSLLMKCGYYAQVMKRTYISIEVELLTAITEYRMGKDKWKDTLNEALLKAEEYHFVRIVSREGAAIRPLLNEIEWKPSEAENDAKRTKYNREFWKQILDETEKMARYYPSYMRAGYEQVILSETMLKILKLQAEGMSKMKIAEELNMTASNVKYHTQQMYKRLGVSNKAEAVMEAGKRGLI